MSEIVFYFDLFNSHLDQKLDLALNLLRDVFEPDFNGQAYINASDRSIFKIVFCAETDDSVAFHLRHGGEFKMNKNMCKYYDGFKWDWIYSYRQQEILNRYQS